jgi:hypothetical protein
MVNRPHPLVWCVGVILAVGILAALTVGAQEPSWALRSEWVYRAEVGAAIVGLLYLPLVALSLAWRGETFRKMMGPGGAGVETPADQIDTAATEFDEFKTDNDAHLARLERAIDELNQRVAELESVGD